MAAITRPDAKHESNCRKTWVRNIINDGLRPRQGNLRLVFRLFNSHPRQRLG